MARYLYSELAAAIDAYKRCEESGNSYADKWADVIALLESHLPHGSGFDSGTKVDLYRSHAEKLVLTTSYHHMDENGYYCGWTDHTVYVTPSFRGINIRITGRNRNDFKEYAYQTFEYCLQEDVEYWLLLEWLPEDKQVKVSHHWLDHCRQVYKVDNQWFSQFDYARDYAVQLMNEVRS